VRRGEVWLANLDPVVGSEADKVRPVIIVSNDTANAATDRNARGVLTVVPVTSNVARVYSFQVFLAQGTAGLAVDSKAQSEQVRSLDVRRLRHRIGGLPTAIVGLVEAALRKHLSL
jgi:mRNA interferase MazF